ALPSIFSYSLGNSVYDMDIIKVVIGILITAFAFLDILPGFQKISFDKKYLPAGGILSGFFGGLSGMQGAMRSAFLIKSGLDKEAFIGTGTVSAVIVDLARLIIYGISFYTLKFTAISESTYRLVAAAIIAAFIGSFIGVRLVKKVTLRIIQLIVGIMLILVGIGIVSGLI
ncbi:MAG: sulfite exporter TauE/SafE family protein, partial [Actinobacteria bacterium]|nr:sulfite exporter TauE/SafE family protein [Actinomycetota bacterium]